MAPRPLDELFRRIVDDLNAMKARFALIGGLAISLRASPRATEDIDFSVVVDTDHAAETFTREIHGRGYIPLQVLENKATGYLATVRFGTRRDDDDQPRVDLLFNSSGIEPEIVRCATLVDLFGRKVPVASLPHLVALKVLSQSEARPQDLEDLRGLLAVATKVDIEEARAALSLITARGCARGKALEVELGTAVLLETQRQTAERTARNQNDRNDGPQNELER